ncbi:MAG: GGDEF domain-containing protein [Tepidisphaeraceae bacterium]
MKTVNSSFYGLHNPVSTINNAVVLLGLQTVKTLALGFSLVGSLNSNKSESFDYDRFWKQSLYSAVAARAIARLLRTPQHDEAFLAGLLSDIGTLVMHLALGREYDVLLEACQGDQVELVRLSREKFDLDHAQVGGMLAEHWKFPALLIEPIRRHHDLTDAGIKMLPLCEIVHVGVLCGEVFAAQPILLNRAHRELRRRFLLTDAEVHGLFLDIESQCGELATLFEIDITPSRGYSDIMNDARQELVGLSLQAQLQVQQFEQQNMQLQRQATVDVLTGLPNRARFNQYLDQAFAECAGLGRPLALLFLDIDKFKSVNDTYGHQAGDTVLRRLGKLLRSKVDQGDLAARYGGEELVMVLKGKEHDVAVRIAEEIRRAIMKETITFEGRTIPVTASIGVAITDFGHPFRSVEEFIDAADRAVYAAKGAGRNCVRVHAPQAGAAPGTGSTNAVPASGQRETLSA